MVSPSNKSTQSPFISFFLLRLLQLQMTFPSSLFTSPPSTVLSSAFSYVQLFSILKIRPTGFTSYLLANTLQLLPVTQAIFFFLISGRFLENNSIHFPMSSPTCHFMSTTLTRAALAKITYGTLKCQGPFQYLCNLAFNQYWLLYHQASLCFFPFSEMFFLNTPLHTVFSICHSILDFLRLLFQGSSFLTLNFLSYFEMSFICLVVHKFALYNFLNNSFDLKTRYIGT